MVHLFHVLANCYCLSCHLGLWFWIRHRRSVHWSFLCLYGCEFASFVESSELFYFSVNLRMFSYWYRRIFSSACVICWKLDHKFPRFIVLKMQKFLSSALSLMGSWLIFHMLSLEYYPFQKFVLWTFYVLVASVVQTLTDFYVYPVQQLTASTSGCRCA